MSFTITDTTYAGEAASGFIVKAITGADTVQGGHVMIKDNIKKQFTIPRYDLGSIIQDRVPTPTTSVGTQTIDGKVLDPQDYMVYFEFNPRDFEDHWEAVRLSPELVDRRLPVTVESVILQEVLKEHANYFETAIWQGDQSGSAPYNKFDGLITKMLADSSVIDAPTPTTLTAGNIFAELEEGYGLIPDSLLYDPALKIFVSYATMELYRAAQQAQTYKGVDVTSGGVMRYNGKQVVPLAGMPNDCYVIAKGSASMNSNLWIGLNSRSDENNIKMAQLQANSELWFIKMLMKADTQTGWGEEVVLYHS